ncbi:N-acetyltransferase [Oceanobacillus arenosus]|uniref:N-acetyltransferase n=1 Tax=Oceanobacillus arenosus TaxID=1229153 RepID=A0A3D8PSL4_9BACI|nr:GNAT family N-acetyltransferase [Oceanobacillus arenosus]RDW19113.1 N-acetyltransferase [Oceanobacillus arenosus]
MLIRYKKNLEKIAMGLLSFMPQEKKDVKKLLQTIKEYETNDGWHLYLWKDEDVLGAIGVKIKEVDKQVIIQHLSVTPSHRNLGIGKQMVHEIRKQYQDKYTVSATDEIQDFYDKSEDISDQIDEQ